MFSFYFYFGRLNTAKEMTGFQVLTVAGNGDAHRSMFGSEELISFFFLIYPQERTEKQNIKGALGMTSLIVRTLWAIEPQKYTLVKKTIRL